MAGLTFTMSGGERLARAAQHLIDALSGQGLADAVEPVAELARDAIRRHAPGGPDTDYAQQIVVRPVRRGAKRVELAVTTDHPGATTQEYGAVIEPKRARVLRFEVDGRVVFTRRAHIPAHPHFRPGWAEAQRAIPRVLADNLRTRLRVAARGAR